MTLFQLKQYVSYLVDDVDFGYFTEPQVTRFLNQALREAQKILMQAGNNWYMTGATRSLIINQSNYKLPCDFLRTNRLELVQNPGVNETYCVLPSMTTNQKSFFPVYGEPQAFYLEKDMLVLAPIPQIDTKVLRLYYSYRVEEMFVNADIPDLPTQFHEFLVYSAAIDCFIKDGRDASLLVRKKEEMQKEMEQDSIERNIDQAASVVITQMGYGDVYY